MAKLEKIEGYSVIVFISTYRSNEDAASDACNVADLIKTHVGPYNANARRPDIEPQINVTCEHCGYIWHGTKDDPDYNGGCCAADEEEHEQRKRDNSQFGVGA